METNSVASDTLNMMLSNPAPNVIRYSCASVITCSA